eukprot:CAMPEP_0197509010 /NCGR_PEP_ID=MMETSP1312-20131121/35921_1 /TAXON_ID=464262 /ORGANISM="Genus nov. species nov., Strain RCC2335" /LENGTH=217 /DNA_ID=CAMNT_0043056839 /DNA_START=15 /DNA_END=669 /DNA_ORIENTATION=-
MEVDAVVRMEYKKETFFEARCGRRGTREEKEVRACTLLEQAGGYVIQSSPFDAFGVTARRPRDPAGRVSRGGEAGVPGQVPEAPPGRQRECLSRGLRPRHERVQLPHGREPAQPVPVDDLARRVRPRAAAKAEVQPRTRGSDHRPAARAGRHQGRPRLRQSSALYAPRERVARACGEPFFEPRGGEEAPGDEEEGCKAEGVIGWRGRWPLVAGLDLS